jgi:hypothetical protein
MDTQLIETYEMNSMSLESTGELTSLEYLLNCPSYDPLKTPALAVNHILSWRLKYDNNGPTPAYIEFRPQDNRSCNYLGP